MSNNENMSESETYLLFEVGNDHYGVKLLSVREVIEPVEAKDIPNTKSYFIGVINIRGEVVGVIDLRERYGYSIEECPYKSYMIIETEDGPLGVVVDKVSSVVSLDKNQIEQETKIASQLPEEFILGIGKLEKNLVTIVDLKSLLESENISQKEYSKSA